MPERHLAAALLCAAAAAAPCPAAAVVATLESTLVWQRQGGGWGGLSAIDVAPDGRTYVMLGDHGQVFDGVILRRAGRITNVVPEHFRVLRDPQGRVYDYADSEGIALDPAGGFYVAFEGPARVAHFAAPDAAEAPLPGRPDFLRFQRNAGFEALARGGDGALYTLPELRPGAWEFPVWRFAGGAWSRIGALPAGGGYLPVGADFGPDGRLYLLERRTFGPFGYQSRVRRFRAGAGGLDGGETVLETARGQFPNLEGLAIWTGTDGDLRLLMVADHGFGESDGETFVEYRLAE